MAGIGLGGGAWLPALAQSCAPQSVIWESGGEAHGTAVLGRLRNGCPVLTQRRGPPGAAPRIELTGTDCDCDLRIDGAEGRFETPHPLVAGRLVETCRANRALTLAVDEKDSSADE